MFDYTDDDYRALCGAGAVQAELGGLDDRRRDAVRRFWLLLVVAIVGSLAIGWALCAMGAIGAGITLGIIGFFVGLGFALKPIQKLGRDIKRPVLDTLAKRGGMSYFADDFAAPVFPDASQILFGRWLSSEVFTDLFQGTDGEGRRYAMYEATLKRRQGRSTVTVFSGQVYTWQRRQPGHADIAIVPDRGIFNFFKPASGAVRVKFDDDAEFEKKFEVYATQASEAQMLLGTQMRRILVELRQAGRVFAYVGPQDVLVAVTGKDRFEPGGMFSSKPGNERVRAMFDDVCGSLATLTRLREAIG
jgi:Protein of unknown function (DUF3137)